jgi:hypothetical protein
MVDSLVSAILTVHVPVLQHVPRMNGDVARMLSIRLHD